MGNPFFNPYAEGGEFPRRAYALVDRLDAGRLFMEAVNADWFDQVGRREMRFNHWLDVSMRAPISIIDASWLTFRRSEGRLARFTHFTLDGEAAGPLWYELELEQTLGDARIHLSLVDPGRPIAISRFRRLPATVASSLNRAFDLGTHVADKIEIQDALRVLRRGVEWIGVYDVGQGSANGMCDSRGVPRAYFDLGGGVLANSSTYPPALRGICTTYDPPVILSHWDWDHWSMGTRQPQTCSLTWIVPNQSLGAVHATFAASVVANGKLLVWPPWVPSLTVGQVTIEKCLGQSGRNHTGLAAVVAGPNGEPPILLTGDARYTAIPSRRGPFTAIVAPHHGADMRSHYTPRYLGLPASRIAYSYGLANTFNHPRNITYQRHHNSGWIQRALHPVNASDLHTADRLGGKLGHIGLTWIAGRSLPRPPCGGRCSLQLTQQ